MWKNIAAGFAAAVVVYAIPFLRAVFSALVTLFHELGHAVAGWLMGYPSLPAFDFVYGGGLTHHGEFRRSVAIAIAVVFAYFAWQFRENRKILAVIGAVFLVWLLFVTREWRREIVFASAGHIGELVLAGIFFHRSLSGRALDAFVAFFVQIHSTLFAWRLLHDDAFLGWYREGKGGALMNDLEVIALNLHIWTGWSPGIDGVARTLFVLSLAVPLIVFSVAVRARRTATPAPPRAPRRAPASSR